MKDNEQKTAVEYVQEERGNVTEIERFYSHSLDIDKAYQMMKTLTTTLTFQECMWIFRNLCYDVWDKKLNDGTYSELQQEQATQLKYGISVNTDLFTQLIVQHNEFNPDYLKQYEVAGPHLLKIEKLKKEIKDLKEILVNLVD